MEGRGALSSVARLLRLWRVYAYLDVMAATRCMRVFLMWWLSDLVGVVGAVTGMVLLAARFDGIGAWSRDQMLFMLGYCALVGGLMGTLFGYNVDHISRRVGRGQMDHTLIEPQPIWMTLLTEGFSPAFGSAQLLPGVALLAWAWPRVSPPVTPAWYAQLAVCLLSSLTLQVSFQYLWGSAAFYAPRGAEEINSSTNLMMMELKPFPLDGVAPALTASLLTIIPAGFIGWYPCRFLLGLNATPAAFWGTPIAAIAMAALAALAFRRGLRHYARIGSSRYLDMGHRR